YEGAVSLAASLAWHLGQTNSEVIFFSQNGKGSIESEATDLHGFLAYLAIVEAKNSVSILENLPQTDGYSIIVTARPRNRIPTSLLASSHVVFVPDALNKYVGSASRFGFRN